MQVKLNLVYNSDFPFFTLLLLISFLLICLLPLHVGYLQARIQVSKTLFNILISPFGKVRFRHFFLADVLTSMVSSLQNTAVIMCYFKTGDFETSTKVSDLQGACPVLYDYKIMMGFLPYWFRFAQCLNKWYNTGLKVHLINAGKYFSDLCVPLVGLPIFLKKSSADDSLLVDEVSAAFWTYCAVHFIATTYSYAWDIIMDWGLLRLNTPGHPNRFLREKINYHPYFYYWSMVTDGLLRFFWVITLFAATKGKEGSAFHSLSIISLISILAEAFRRAQWALIRVENEQNNNLEAYRTIPIIPPIVTDTRRPEDKQN